MKREGGKKERALRFVLSYEHLRRAVEWLFAAALVVLTGVLVVQHPEIWYFPLAFGVGLTVNFFLKHRLKLAYRWRACLYAVDFALLFSITYFAGDDLTSTLYFLELGDFYFGTPGGIGTIVMTVASFAAYFVSLYLCGALPGSWGEMTSFFFNQLVLFMLMFTVINLLVAVLRKNDRIEKNLREIAQREEKLREAYKSLEEVTVLEERNRIAKQIHDTTGHSITTIIMQTEAAKLIIDTDPEEAKRKIVSAHMLAVNALEEMRKSVRLISGEEERFDLFAALDRTIAETTEGTGVVIRSKIDSSICADAEIGRFIYNTFKEGLNNGIRHGASTAFFFELEKKDGALYFLLSDNGSGTDAIEPGFGLKTMSRQAEELGGKAKFSSEKGEGFEIELTLPEKKAEKKTEKEVMEEIDS